LKSQVGGERLQVVIHARERFGEAAELLARLAGAPPQIDERTRELLVPASGGAGFLVEAIRELDAAGITVDDIALRRPTLDDVFLALTGRAAEETGDQDDELVPAGGKAGNR
jgi:ABC-2 type transport system ATP-binding protein